MKKPTCKTGLKKNLVSKEVYDRELQLCGKLSKDNGGCGWGKCKDCGVVLLLHKLHKGELIEDPKEIERMKSEIAR